MRLLTEVEPMIVFLLDDEPARDAEAWTKAMVKGKAAPEMLAATIAELDAAHRLDRRRRSGRRSRPPRSRPAS